DTSSTRANATPDPASPLPSSYPPESTERVPPPRPHLPESTTTAAGPILSQIPNNLYEQVGALAAAGAWVRHEWTNQHVADPYLIRLVSLEATECTWLAGQGRTLATALEMLANGPLGNADAMASEENGADLRRRASGQLDPQG